MLANEGKAVFAPSGFLVWIITGITGNTYIVLKKKKIKTTLICNFIDYDLILLNSTKLKSSW